MCLPFHHPPGAKHDGNRRPPAGLRLPGPSYARAPFGNNPRPRRPPGEGHSAAPAQAHETSAACGDKLLILLETPSTMEARSFEPLRALAVAAAADACAPYSGRRDAAVLLLSDGAWIPGVRVESASFPLVLPAVVNAFTTAVAAGRRDVVAAVLSGPARPEEHLYLEAAPTGRFAAVATDVFTCEGGAVLPAPAWRLDPFLPAPPPATVDAGVALARDVAQRAYVPESAFRVGCVLETADGRLLPGVNVEHPDWTRILCAERNALGTAFSYGVGGLRRLFLTCPDDPAGSPCGACRQLLAEHAPEITIWMDRGPAPAERTSPEWLLPGSFAGQGLSRRA